MGKSNGKADVSLDEQLKDEQLKDEQLKDEQKKQSSWRMNFRPRT